MCCFFTVLMLLGPRAAILVWSLADPVRWAAAFPQFIWSLLGFLFLGTNRPPEPFLNVGVDPSEDGLRCTRTRPSPG